MKKCKRCGHLEKDHKFHCVSDDNPELEFYKCLACDCQIHSNVLQTLYEVIDDNFEGNEE